MKRIVLLFALLFAGCAWASAQDVITTKKGEDIKAKVVEVGLDEIRYLKEENLDGPTYVMRRSDILLIRYANGEKDVFYEEKPLSLNVEEEDGTQFYPNKKYRELRNLYNPRNYVRQYGDPYSPASAGVASWVLPGLGQCISGEVGRGVAVFCGYSLFTVALAINMTYYDGFSYDRYYQNQYQYESQGIDMAAGLMVLSYCGFYIWNIVDAVRVAKVKNMYYQDMNGLRSSLDLKVEPYFNCTPSATTAGLQPVGGLSLKVNF